jgi:drug/metabolite transporter (DMT)-like permease
MVLVLLLSSLVEKEHHTFFAWWGLFTVSGIYLTGIGAMNEQ